MGGPEFPKAIVHGVQEGHFGYVSGPKPSLSTEGKYEVAPSKVRFKVAVPEDEIDLDSGFLMLPQAIPQAASPATPVLTGVGPGEETEIPPGGGIGGIIPPTGVVPPGLVIAPAKPGLETTVELSFTADRNGLFTAWNAMANLADLAGKVTLTVRADSEKGFDKAKLQNGVLEPLREADLID